MVVRDEPKHDDLRLGRLWVHFASLLKDPGAQRRLAQSGKRPPRLLPPPPTPLLLPLQLPPLLSGVPSPLVVVLLPQRW